MFAFKHYHWNAGFSRLCGRIGIKIVTEFHFSMATIFYTLSSHPCFSPTADEMPWPPGLLASWKRGRRVRRTNRPVSLLLAQPLKPYTLRRTQEVPDKLLKEVEV